MPLQLLPPSRTPGVCCTTGRTFTGIATATATAGDKLHRAAPNRENRGASTAPATTTSARRTADASVPVTALPACGGGTVGAVLAREDREDLPGRHLEVAGQVASGAA
jgi:hypothetical protein